MQKAKQPSRQKWQILTRLLFPAKRNIKLVCMKWRRGWKSTALFSPHLLQSCSLNYHSEFIHKKYKWASRTDRTFIIHSKPMAMPHKQDEVSISYENKKTSSLISLLIQCPGLGWDRGNFLLSSSCSAVF